MTDVSTTRIRDQFSNTAVGIPLELGVLVCIGTALRSFRLGAESFWLDEVFTVQVATEYTLHEIVFELPMTEPHPPLYNVLMWGWIQLVGTSEAAVRGPTVLIGVLSIVMIYVLARALFDRTTAGIAATIFAISPLHIWYSQEARMYGLLVLLTLVSFYALVRVIEGEEYRWSIGYVLAGVALGYLHVFGLFVLLVHAGFLVWRRIRGRSAVSTSRILGLYGGIGVLTFPWTGLLLHRTVAPERYPADPSGWLGPPNVNHLLEIASLFAFGATRHTAPYDVLTHPSEVFFIVIVACFLFLIGAYRLTSEEEHRWQVQLVSIWLIIPVVLPFVLSFVVRPMFDLRYVIVAAPAFVILVSRGIRVVRFEHFRYLLIVLVISALIVPLPGYYAEPHKDQWEDAADVVAADAGPDDVIVVVPGWTWYGTSGAFAYYFDRHDIPIYPLYGESSEATFEQAVSEGEDVYLVVSYTTDREKVLQKTAAATETAPDERHEFVNVEVIRFTGD